MLVVGDVLADVSARLAAPLAADSDTPAAITLECGGAGAHVAAWLARLGADTTFVGAVGTDWLGRRQRQDLRRRGVTLRGPVLRGRPTGVVVALVGPDGGRTMVTSRGASAGLRPRHLPARLFIPGGHLHLSGYVLLDPDTRSAGLAALERARAASMTISVDPSSHAPLDRVGAGTFRGWTRGADILLPNLDEGRVLTGATDPEAIVADLAPDYGVVVLTLGPAGALWARGAERQRLAAPGTRVVDTTGAGDAFTAGWLAAWLDGASPSAALAAAAAAAATAVTEIGGRPPAGAGPRADRSIIGGG